MDKDDNKNTQQNLTSAENQENKKNQNKVSNSAVKGLATGAGAALGGKVGAAVGSKAADVINNSNIRNKTPKLQENFPNQNGLISPNNQQLKKQSPNSQLPTSSLQTDTNSEKTSPTTNNKNQLDKTNNQRSSNKNVSRELSNKNPTQNKYANILKKHSKHANGNNNEDKDIKSDTPKKDNPLINRLNPLRKRRMLSQNKQNAENEENEIEETTGQQVLNVLGGTFKKILSIVAGMIGVTPFVLSGILIAILIIVICVIIIPIISIFSFYGKEEDGTACYNTPSCNKVVIKSEAGDKTYSLDEYIAGAIVNYYDHDSYAVADADVDQNLLKAFSVIIHSDIAAYSDYDGNNETCTINEESRFSDIYIPTSNDYTSDDTTTDSSSNENSGNSSDNEVDGVSGAAAGQNTQVDDSTTENEETKKKDKYYNQAKSAAASVLSEVVDIYTQRINIFYDGYKTIVNTSSVTGNDYKTIIRDYIKGSPDYEAVENDSLNNDGYTDEDTKDDNNGDPVGIYPVCSFQKANSSDGGTIGTIVMNDLCSQVVLTDKMVGNTPGHNTDYSGTYSYDEFIAGVVANETYANWSAYPDILKAHAVAARTWLYNAVKSKYYSSVDGDTCYFTSSTYSMGFKPNTSAEITQAVIDTSGEYITVNGQIVKNAKWDAFTYSSVDDKYYTLKQKGLKIPKEWIESRISKSTINYNHTYSHGEGMSQWGAAYMVMEQGKNYKDVIKFFYDADIAKTSNGYVMPINTFSSINGEKSVGYCGSKEPHNGLDFGAPSGTPVYAATSGVIEKEYSYVHQCYQKKGTTNPYYKDCVKGTTNYGDNMAGQGFKIKNDDGTYSVYFHFSKKENLHVGDRVTAGQKIGEVGTTGYSSGPHLHYEMRLTTVGNAVEPRDYLPMEGYSICYNYPGYK